MTAPRTIREAIQPLLLVNILIGMGHFEFRPRAVKLVEIAYSAIYATVFTLLASYADDYFDIRYFRSTLDITQTMARWIYYSNGIVMVSLIVTARINTDVRTYSFTLAGGLSLDEDLTPAVVTNRLLLL